MDQHEWGLFRETVGYRTQPRVLGSDTEDATYDELLAAIGQPQHPQADVAKSSPGTRRRRVDLIRQKVRDPDPAATADPADPGAENRPAGRDDADWVPAPLTELPDTTREVARAAGSAATASPGTRSIRSRCTRRPGRGPGRPPGTPVPPMRAVLGAVRSHPAVTSTALAITIPVVVAALVLLPGSDPRIDHAGSPAVGTALPLPATALPEPRSGGPATPEELPSDDPAEPAADNIVAAPERQQPSADAGGAPAPLGSSPIADQRPGSASGSAESRAEPADPVRSEPAPTPEGRTTPPPDCDPDMPVIEHLGCALAGLFGQITGVNGEFRTSLPSLVG